MDESHWIELLSNTNDKESLDEIAAYTKSNPLPAITLSIGIINQDELTSHLYAHAFTTISNAFVETKQATWQTSTSQFLEDLKLALLRGLMFEDITIQNIASKDIATLCFQLRDYSSIFPLLSSILESTDYSTSIKIAAINAFREIVSICPVEPEAENSTLFHGILQICTDTLSKRETLNFNELQEKTIIESMTAFYPITPSTLNDLTNFQSFCKTLNQSLLRQHETEEINYKIFENLLQICVFLYPNLNEFYDPSLKTIIANGLSQPQFSIPCITFLKEMLKNQSEKQLTSSFDLTDKIMTDHFKSVFTILESETIFDQTPDDNEDSPIISLIEMLSMVYLIAPENFFQLVEEYFNQHITSNEPHLLYASLLILCTLFHYNEQSIYPFFVNCIQNIKNQINPDTITYSNRLVLFQSFITISSLLKEFPDLQYAPDYDMSELLEIPEFLVSNEEDDFIKYSLLIVDSLVTIVISDPSSAPFYSRVESLISNLFKNEERMKKDTYRESVSNSLCTLMSKTSNLQTLRLVSDDLIQRITKIFENLNAASEDHSTNIIFIRDYIRVLNVILKRLVRDRRKNEFYDEPFFDKIIILMSKLLKKQEYMINDDVIDAMIYLIRILKHHSFKYVDLILPDLIDNLKQRENISSFRVACKGIGWIIHSLKEKIAEKVDEIVQILLTSLDADTPFELIGPVLKTLMEVFSFLPFKAEPYAMRLNEMLNFLSSPKFNLDEYKNNVYMKNDDDFMHDCITFYLGLMDGIIGFCDFIIYESEPKELCDLLIATLKKFFITSIKKMQQYIQPNDKLLIKFACLIDKLYLLQSILPRISPMIHKEAVQSLIDFGLRSENITIKTLYQQCKEKF